MHSYHRVILAYLDNFSDIHNKSLVFNRIILHISAKIVHAVFLRKANDKTILKSSCFAMNGKGCNL